MIVSKSIWEEAMAPHSSTWLNYFTFTFRFHALEKEMATHSSVLCSCLENPRDGGAWKAAVHGVTEGRTWLSDFTFTFHFHALEKEMATHSSVLTWRIPGTGEPSGLPSMGSHRVGYDLSDLAAAAGPSVLLQMSLFHYLLWLSNIPLYIFFIHSSVDGHLHCFHALAIEVVV